ncbi:sensor histidine kinase [Actinoallomurus iriomotensis]|uniref:histidine kinase n=1 Tax=Actinoallomurus iriomotensis TaxID=478107 RepID=A0A9W6VSZ0_9ACTN|nr:histidine kinase [Actinoallomurus iriomotensis]GLY78007.1 two-component sensor histidine kinase [Actinoallomurus iriomotensis]
MTCDDAVAKGSPRHDPRTGASAPARWVRLVSGFVRGVDARHPLWWDVGPPIALALVTLPSYLGAGPVTWAVWLGFVVPLPWRRRHPFRVLLAMAVPAVVSLWNGAVPPNALGLCVALYGVALRSAISRVTWSGLLTGAAIAADVTWWPGDGLGLRILTGLMPCAASVLLGLFVRIRREEIAALEDKAALLERERDQQARLAAAAERNAIAREMHDIIGHNLSVIVGLADGGRFAAAKAPNQAVQALEAISDTSRQALGELRRVLGILRDGDPARRPATLAPQPTLADLGELLTRLRDTGLTVRYTTTGSPHDLSAGYQLMMYRMVQESLTNVLKHAGPDCEAQVRVRHGPEGVSVTVTNTGGPATVAAGADGTGQGLTGIRERAALYDGTLRTGPLPSGGWHVDLWLPREQDR